jgi:hypothetical protein
VAGFDHPVANDGADVGAKGKVGNVFSELA